MMYVYDKRKKKFVQVDDEGAIISDKVEAADEPQKRPSLAKTEE